MSDLVSLLKCLSEQGFLDFVEKKKDYEPFSIYVLENISTGKKITIYNKLLYLYQTNDYSFIYSNLGPYSPDITEEIIELRKWIPKNERVLNSADNYESMNDFLTSLKESAEELTFDKLIELSINKWNENFGHKY